MHTPPHPPRGSRGKRGHLRPLAAALACAGLAWLPAQAANYTWQDGATGDWNDPALWQSSAAPAGGDLAAVLRGTVDVSTDTTVGSLFLVGTGAGAARLTITTAVDFETGTAVLGNNPGVQGHASLSGGATWYNTGALSVGSIGLGTLLLSDGTGLDSGSLYLGADTGGEGTLRLSSGAALQAGTFEIGTAGKGALIASGAATLLGSGDTVLGTGPDSEGSAVVYDGTQWAITGQLTAGSQGLGQVSVSDGAGIVADGKVTLGAAAGSTGTLDVDDADFVTLDMLYVGVLGDGEASAANGGTIQAAGGVVVARGGDSDSALRISGTGTRLNTAGVRLGGDVGDPANAGGQGLLAIEDGARAHVSDVWLGDVVGAHGALGVTGDGSRLVSSARLSVGHRGTGEVLVTDGGRIESQGLLLGHEAGGEGVAVLLGRGSAWDSDGTAYVGNVGTGVLYVLEGAALTSTDGYVGTEAAHGPSLAVVAGPGSRWINSGDFFAGHNAGATGAVAVTGGALLQSRQGILGDLAGSQGSLVVEGQGSRWQTSGDLNVGRLGSGELIVASGGTVAAPVIQIANNAGSEGVLYVGAPEGTAPLAPGRLQTPHIRFGEGDARLVFNFAGPSLTFGGRITGDGALDLLAGDLTLSGRSSYTGPTSVAGGTLRVNGALAGPVAVARGATLAGSGSVGSITLAPGAILAPGNSIGTLHVDGDLAFSPGSVYRVEASPASPASDSVVVGGTARLAGSVLHVGPGGDFTPGLRYTILRAGTIEGRFDSVDSDYAFLDPTLDYGTQEVGLGLVQARDFATAAATGNQRAVAGALDSLPQGHPVRDFVATLAQGTAGGVFDSLSGEVHGSVGASLAGGAARLSQLPLARLRANLQAPMRPGAPTALAGASDLPVPATALPASAAQPAWAEVVGGWQTLDGDGNAARVRQHTGGLFVGADQPVGAGWRLGGALGYTDGKSRVDDRSSQADVGSYSALVYGGKSFAAGPGAWSLLLGTGYTWHDISTRRQAAGQAAALRADYGASTAQLFSEISYAWRAAPRTTLAPYAGMAWMDQRLRGFSESGGPAALRGESGRHTQTHASLGLRASQAFMAGGREARVHGMLGWRHAFGDLRTETTLAFDASQPFTVAGAPIARNAALVELGADMDVARSATVGLAYSGQFGSGSREHAASLQVRWTF